MNRFFKLSVLFFLYNLPAFAQVPKGINYQGVARLATGTPIAGKTISIKISLLQNSPTGTIEYAETHQPTTNEFGLFTLVIGQGTVSTGNFDFVSWANGSKWLQLEMDLEGGNNYSLIGSQQLMSVPYSYYAQYAGNSLKAGAGLAIENNIITNTGDGDNNASNELITNVALGADKVLRITDAGGTKQADLSVLEGTVQNLSMVLNQGTDAGTQKITNLGAPIIGTDAATKTYVDNHVDADGSPTNEIQDLNLTGNNLAITNNPSATSINLAPYLDNTDNQNLSLSPVTGTSRTVTISNGTSVTFDVADNDNNATNEIQALTKTGAQLSLSNGGGIVTLNDDSNTNEIQTLSKSGSTISLTGGGSVLLNDDSNTNELQDLNRVGNTLNLTGDATTVDLSHYLDNTDGQTLTTQSVDANTRSIAITGGNIINVDVRDADASVTNEIQDLSINGVTNILSLTNDATTVNLTPYLDNTDNQNLSLTTPVVGTNRTINISNGTNVTFDVADNDNNSTNEIQTLSKTGATIALTGGGSISLNDDSNTNEIQSLTYTPAANNLTISGGNTVAITHTLGQVLTQSNDALASKITNLGTPTVASDATTKQYVDNLDAADLDKSVTNEIQNLSSVLGVSNDAGTSKITNLGTPTIASDAATKQYVDNLDAADLDKSISNEIQNLTYIPATNNLAISGGNNVSITHTLGQVLATGNDAGGLRIQNLGSPTGATDATTRAFVENSISTNFAFKVNYSFTNGGVPVANQLVNLGAEVFDDFNVIAANRFTVPANGSGFYTFYADGTSTNTSVTLKLRLNSTTIFPIKRQTSFPSALIINDTQVLMLKLVAGDFIELIVDSSNSSDQATGVLFGNKL